MTKRYNLYQGHPTDRFGKLSGRKALNPYNFLKIIFASNFRDIGNLRPGVFGLLKMSFWVPKKGQLRFSSFPYNDRTDENIIAQL